MADGMGWFRVSGSAVTDTTVARQHVTVTSASVPELPSTYGAYEASIEPMRADADAMPMTVAR